MKQCLGLGVRHFSKTDTTDPFLLRKNGLEPSSHPFSLEILTVDYHTLRRVMSCLANYTFFYLSQEAAHGRLSASWLRCAGSNDGRSMAAFSAIWEGPYHDDSIDPL